jgi:N-acetylmuramoyl-L-alanine amidase
MKLIESYKSPNFNERKNYKKLSYLILHYTAMTSCQEALEYMCDKKNKVSAHFLVSKKGDIYYLVDLKERAWHAGKSYWKGFTDLNSRSIGIEIDNSGDCINKEKYNNIQIKSLCQIIRKLIKEYNIIPDSILGHSDVAPFRKIDPGENFPWNTLNKRKLSYLPKIKKKIIFNKLNKINDEKIKIQKEEVLKKIGEIGYDIRNVKKNDKKFKLLIKTYQRHYRQSNVTGEVDRETIELIREHHKDLLTL